MPTEAEILNARLARMRVLLDSLEAVCAASEEQRAIFLKLKREMDAATAALKSKPARAWSPRATARAVAIRLHDRARTATASA
jgi:hypothetical protein